MSSHERFTFTFVSKPGSAVPLTQRLKRLLKLAGRQLYLRCVDASQTSLGDDEPDVSQLPQHDAADAQHATQEGTSDGHD